MKDEKRIMEINKILNDYINENSEKKAIKTFNLDKDVADRIYDLAKQYKISASEVVNVALRKIIFK